MKTKSHVRFFNRAAHLDVDLELADVVKISIQQGLLSATTNQYVFNAVDAQQHPRLASRANTGASRKLAASHLNATLCEAFIKNIFEDTTQYLLEVLKAAARNGLDPNRLIGQHSVTFEANTILQAGNWNKIVEMVSESVFRKLENKRSTKTLLQEINNKLNLGVAQTTIDAALPYLQIRHLLVHSDGKADQEFCNSFPALGAVVGQKIKLDSTLLNNVRTTVCALINEFDQKIVAGNVVANNELQP